MIKLKSADSYRAKNAPLWIALRRSGIMLFTQPAAGGESCRGRILFRVTKNVTELLRMRVTDYTVFHGIMETDILFGMNERTGNITSNDERKFLCQDLVII